MKILFPIISLIYLKDIHWPGSHDGPPADVPECGFLGNDPKCQYNGTDHLNGDVLFMLMLTLFVITSFGCFMIIFYYIYCK